ncbi:MULTISPECIES: Ig-like domain-containing protein [unclassified Bradyrhizobium]|uniref:Ig-like domain-containing protein n=1 Tax=unclassified Bradyrhizobium TaxID=2631580 RepID=UPI001FFB6C89|nr:MULTISPECIES: Ig-like domain-containing protein [unclassified Bradyrhizobium]MCK1709732.1 cadherin-like domain-containing protein [Bradyrhizobium sp. 143]MCK1727575.1 cadherin-like domain-containing protein [Bradyrhizobium sp. 142]
MARGTYVDFLNALGQRESSGVYTVENRLHYLGKYQMGELAFIDIGLVNPDSTPGNNDYSGGFTGKYGVNSKADFLNSPAAQDSAIRDYMAKQFGFLGSVLQYDGQTLNDVPITLSGMLGGAHLVGAGAARTYLNSGGDNVPADGNGVDITEYIKLFNDYQTPFTINHDKAETISGGAGKDKLFGNGGNDVLNGKGGDDFLDGGADADTAVFSGKPGDYNIVHNTNNTWTFSEVRGDKVDGTDQLNNIEFAQFGDGQKFALTKDGIKSQTDFAFVIDTTGSMGSSIGAVKAQATAILGKLFGTTDNPIDAHVGIVGFKDPGEVTGLLSFTTQDELSARKQAAVAAINGISVGGGGDIPEGDYSGLLYALQGNIGAWRDSAGSRKIILFTDAPAKDGYLAPLVSSYAHSIGASITSSSLAPTAFGSVSTFALTSAALADDSAPSSFNIQIFTIQVGNDPSATPDLQAIAALNNGQFFAAGTNPDELTNAILKIIDLPPPGTNHAPVIDLDLSLVANSISEKPGLTGSLVKVHTAGVIAFTDSDVADRPTFATNGDTIAWQSSLVDYTSHLTASQIEAFKGAFDVAVQAGNTNVGKIDWSFTIEDNKLDFLAAGESITATRGLIVDDHNGADVTQQISVTIVGANDNPVGSSDSNGTAKNSSLSISASQGVLANDTDPDVHDHLAVSSVNGSASNVGHVVKGTYGSLTLSADGSYAYIANKGALPSQIVAQDTFNYTVSDGHGGSSTSTLSIVVSNPDAIYQSGMNTTLSGTINEKNVLDGSAGHDVLIGGSAPDVLIAGNGDALTGGLGPDAFVFRPNFGTNVITDFSINNDSLQFAKSIFANVNDVLQHTTNTVAGAIINDGHGDTITLTGITLAQLQVHQGDFHLI